MLCERMTNDSNVSYIFNTHNNFHPMVFLEKVKMMPSSHSNIYTCPQTYVFVLVVVTDKALKYKGAKEA